MYSTLSSDFVERKTSESGAILMLAFVIMTILMILIAQISVTTTSSKIASDNYIKSLQLDYAMQSMYYYALEYLKFDLELDKDQDRKKADFLQEPWATTEGINHQIDAGESPIDATVFIRDTNRFINISFLKRPDGQKDSITESMLNNLKAVTGLKFEVENIYNYMKTKNTYFDTLDELKNVDGITDDILYGTQEQKGLIEFITVWPKPVPDPNDPTKPYKNKDDYKMNFNTASKEILMSASKYMTDEAAQALISYRESSDDNGLPQFYDNSNELDKALEDVAIQEKSDLLKDLQGCFLTDSKGFIIEVSCKLGTITKKRMTVLQVKVEQTEQQQTESLEKIISYPIIRYDFPDLDEMTK